MNEEKIITGTWLGKPLSLRTGKLAKQADASVLVQYGETVVMATVVQSKNEREGIDFFPLMVEFEEKLYAAGMIKGSRWVKREGRPTDQSILTGRMIDRAIRPLFNDNERRDVQLIVTVLSVDGENDYDIVSLIAASAALSISGIEWNGPIGGIRVGLIENEFVFNPSYEQQALSSLDLIVAGTSKKTIMLEAGANEIKEDIIFNAIKEGQSKMQEAIDLIKKLQQEVTVKTKDIKKKLLSADDIKNKEEKERLLNIGREWLSKNIKENLFNKIYYTKNERKMAMRVIKEQLDEYLFSQNIEKAQRDFVIKSLVEIMVEEEVTNAILNEKRRVDGRALNEIRLLSADTTILPRNHGTGLFSRGETQVLSIVTLGAPGMEQTLEGIEGQSKKRYMHHYNFPPYCVGEASPLRGTGRREIGHGALAEKAIIPVLPKKEDFPYTIRVVSETLGSNGSSSMASTCGSSLALMDAGVPIKTQVGGIAMGLASNKDMSRFEVLTDIQDLEDGPGGMDFKITGTKDGLTAIQLDTKTDGLTEEIIAKTFKQGREALNQVLDVLNKELSTPRADLSPYAPRIISFRVNPEKIGAIIGPGGKIINKIIEETEVSIDIDDDGLVMICSTNSENGKKAEKMVKDIVREYEVGEIFTGKVVRLMDFGAFVQLSTNQDGMVHVSEMAPYRVSRPSDLVNIGDTVQVKIKEIDAQGRINLSMKGLVENEILWKDKKGESSDNGGFHDRGGNGYNNNHSNFRNKRPNFDKKF
ncbi:MAG TPA: polyribonucleotide nucleotidyltransferase [bacterium]|nr:polyribonucleotide nucleotidyltransferase [bacterium]